MCVRYFKVQWKKAVQILPYLLCYLLIAGIILTSFFVLCTKVLGEESLAGKMNIGVVKPEDDETAELAVSLVTSMDSVSSVCEFAFYPEDEGRTALQKGEIYALVEIPEHLVQGILNGENRPITIVTMQNAGMETKLFQTLSDSGIEMLSLAQTGIYATDEYIAESPEFEDLGAEINEKLNTLYINYAMSRTDLFDDTEISATGDLSFGAYYLGAGLVLLIMLTGVPYAFYYCNHVKSVEQKLKVQGMIAAKRIPVEYAAISLLHVLIVGSILLLTYLVKDKLGIRIFDYIQLCIACEVLALSAMAFIQLIYTACNQIVWGVFTVFFATILLVFLSGGIVPLVFLPDVFEKVSNCLPTTWWIRMAGQGIRSELQSNTIFVVVGIGLLCMMLSCMIASIKEGRREHR